METRSSRVHSVSFEQQSEDESQVTSKRPRQHRKPPVAIGKRRRHRYQRRGEFEASVRRVKSHVCPDLRLSARGAAIGSSFVGDMMERIAEEAKRLCLRNGRRTILKRDVEVAVLTVLKHTELAEIAVHRANVAVANAKHGRPIDRR